MLVYSCASLLDLLIHDWSTAQFLDVSRCNQHTKTLAYLIHIEISKCSALLSMPAASCHEHRPRCADQRCADQKSTVCMPSIACKLATTLATNIFCKHASECYTAKQQVSESYQTNMLSLYSISSIAHTNNRSKFASNHNEQQGCKPRCGMYHGKLWPPL